MFGPIISIFGILFGLAYKWLEQNVINYILNFVRDFEHAFVMLAVIAFLLAIAYMTIKQVKRLPKYYVIEIVDVFGHKTILDGLRVSFDTFNAVFTIL